METVTCEEVLLLKIVDQMSYMVEVKRNLFYKFRNEELYAVLSDLMSVFNEGYSHGKTDEIIIDELGTPEDFSDEVCCYEKKTVGKAKKALFCLASMLMLFCFGLCTSTFNPVVHCLTLLIMLKIIWEWCGGSSLLAFEGVNEKNPTTNGIILGTFIIQVLQMMILASVYLLVNQFSKFAQGTLKIVNYIVIAYIFICFMLMIKEIKKLENGFYRAICRVSLYMGAIISSIQFIMFIMNYGGHAYNFIGCIVPYTEGSIMFILVKLFFDKRMGK